MLAPNSGNSRSLTVDYGRHGILTSQQSWRQPDQKRELNLGVGMQGPRVAIVGIWLESNRHAPIARHDDFKSYYCLEGTAILDAARAANPLIMGEAAAFVKTMDATGPWTPLPMLLAGCHPHGPVDGALMARFLETIRTGLAEAGALDAVYIANHG